MKWKVGERCRESVSDKRKNINRIITKYLNITSFFYIMFKKYWWIIILNNKKFNRFEYL